LYRRPTPEYARANKEFSLRASFFLAAAMTVAVTSPLAAAPRHAERPTANGVDDPWERFNRAGFAIEGKLDRWIIGPLAHIYKFLTPGPIGKGIHNLVTNLTEPVVTVNGILQLRPKRAADSLGRFLVNSTVGLAGLIDVAGKEGHPHRPNSFGDTLGRYGVAGGPYIFYPLGGPSTVRDTVGEIVDNVMDPVHLLNYRYRTEISISVEVASGLDQRVENEEDLKTLLSDAADPYATLRSTFLQSRVSEIRGEDATPSALPDLDLPALPGSEPAPAGSSTAPRPSASLGGGLLLGAEDQPAPLQPLPDQQGR
jgi:phospholipid-binding lipoprotein MlaA